MTTNPTHWCGGCQKERSTHEDFRDYATKSILIVRCDHCNAALQMDITDKTKPKVH